MSKNNEIKITFPFYQVKAAGQVVDHTNRIDSAEQTFREATKPAELWEINSDGSAKLVRRTAGR